MLVFEYKGSCRTLNRGDVLVNLDPRAKIKKYIVDGLTMGYITITPAYPTIGRTRHISSDRLINSYGHRNGYVLSYEAHTLNKIEGI